MRGGAGGDGGRFNADGGGEGGWGNPARRWQVWMRWLSGSSHSCEPLTDTNRGMVSPLPGALRLVWGTVGGGCFTIGMFFLQSGILTWLDLGSSCSPFARIVQSPGSISHSNSQPRLIGAAAVQDVKNAQNSMGSSEKHSEGGMPPLPPMFDRAMGCRGASD